MMVKQIKQPRDMLLPYQLKWVQDRARFKFGLMSRQVGKDFSSTCEAVEDCNFVVEPQTGQLTGLRKEATKWTILATGERQALESMDQAKLWAEAYDLAIDSYEEIREGGPETLIKSSEIVFGNKSRLRAIPAKPSTARGASSNVIFTEFAFHENPDAIWAAAAPFILNPLRGGEKRCIIITTPNGLGNKAADIWLKGDKKVTKWSRHKVTIYDAVAQGLPVNVEEIKEFIGDDEIFAQEFLCMFIDSAAILLPYELIALCENSQATAAVDASYWDTALQFPRFMGIDFGRKKDLSVAWTAESIANYRLTREVLELRKMPTPEQVEILSPRIKRCVRVCLDYTGPGIGMGDYLVKEHGEWDPQAHKFGKIELCTFTQSLKCEIFPKLRMAFEAKAIGVPVNKEIREDLHSVYRLTTKQGGVSYGAPHTADGHADRTTALALCVRAASDGGLPSGIGRRMRGGLQRPQTSGRVLI